MMKMWRNTEFRGAVIRLLILEAIVGACLILGYFYQVEQVKNEVVDQSSTLIGKVIRAHPELQDEIVGIVTKEGSRADKDLGASVLSKYGYQKGMPAIEHPILGQVLLKGILILTVFLILCTLLRLFHTYIGYRYMYKKVIDISVAAERVVDGDFEAKLPEGEEGDFDILGHRFNQMSQRLQKSLSQLREEKVFLKNIISDISHQLKTPLSTLILYHDLMSGERTMEEDTRKRFLEDGRQQLERLEWLIQSLLKMARLEAGSIQFKKEPVELLESLRDAAASLNGLAQEKEVTLYIENEKKEILQGDKRWLQEAWTNIIKNAIEHSPEGGRVTIRQFSTPLSMGFTVEDTGGGIAPRDLPHVFKRFYKGSHSQKSNSIGIGLALAKTIIEGQEGSISVKSEMGKGSEFTVTFLKTLGK